MAARKLHLGKDKSGDAVSSGVRKSEKIRKGTMRGRAVRSAQVAHNHQVAGSNPAPAIMGLARKKGLFEQAGRRRTQGGYSKPCSCTFLSKRQSYD